MPMSTAPRRWLHWDDFLTAVRSVSPSKDFICSKISRGKQNGLGREHGYEALEHYLETKGVVVET
jgi:hypothetical protein